MGVAYIVNATPANGNMSLVATTRTVRIIRVDATATLGGGSAVSLTFSRLSGAGHSGGSLLTPGALRAATAAPPAVSTVRSNNSVTGTPTQIGYDSDFTPDATNKYVKFSLAPPVDALIAPGFGFRALITSGVPIQSMALVWEELQLDWSL